jgi:cell shape-determining protein MreC
MEFDQKEETPFNIPEKKKADKKTLAIYIITGVITLSSLIYGYASYQSTYFKDAEIQKLKLELEEANTKLLRIDALENQVKELEASLVAKAAAKAESKKVTKVSVKKVSAKKDIKKVNATKKAVKKSKTTTKAKEKKPVKK